MGNRILLRFIQWSKKSRAAVALGIALGGTATALALLTNLFSFVEHFRQPEAFQLADNSSKARLSQEISEIAWRRLFLANLYAYRIEDKASYADINDAWKAYVDADVAWNSNIMEYIVGIDRYYGRAKSIRFETVIQAQFSSLDTSLRALRTAKFVRDLRDQTTSQPDADYEAAVALAGKVHQIHDQTQTMMYLFVRCIPPPGADRQETRAWGCDD